VATPLYKKKKKLKSIESRRDAALRHEDATTIIGMPHYIIAKSEMHQVSDPRMNKKQYEGCHKSIFK
jgi:hypothetical protein